ncbi:uncharacterized protein LOC108829724 [Raphanus sativus]|uniref:Uncharacterized protein LOC108829724 n=1 Tax=Raphanus sativus TaxID=3726 RepID=A0A6J0LFI2_RAPSA|nr:uncharacterized protein LOC108829724 [Raphanus sativus]
MLHQSRQSITCELDAGNSNCLTITACYAANLNTERSDLWVDLINVQQQLSLDSSPWVVGGDFNQISHFSEHSLPSVNCYDSPMSEFRDTLSHLGIFDLRFTRPLHTWSNKCPSSRIAKKLDRILVNQPWVSSFPHSQATFLPPDISDHAPAILNLAVNLPTSGTKPFKFFNYLTKHPLFYQTVLQAWHQSGSIAWDLSHLCVKLKKIKSDIKKLNRENFSDIQERVRVANRLLNDAQVLALTHPTQENFLKEKELHDKWEFLRTIEESYFRQRSRINWLREGDHNTTFFHRLMQVRNSYNSIRSFTLSTGEVVTDPVVMGVIAISHFQQLLAPQTTLTSPCSLAWFQALSPFRCPESNAQAMILLPSDEEIERMLFKLNANKTSGPDSLTSELLKAAWNFLGAEALPWEYRSKDIWIQLKQVSEHTGSLL